MLIFDEKPSYDWLENAVCLSCEGSLQHYHDGLSARHSFAIDDIINA